MESRVRCKEREKEHRVWWALFVGCKPHGILPLRVKRRREGACGTERESREGEGVEV